MSNPILKKCFVNISILIENKINNITSIEHWASKTYVKRRSDGAIP